MVAPGVCVVALGGCMVFLGGRAWFFPGGPAWFFLGGACVVFSGRSMRRIRRDTVNERVVRILLECILVYSECDGVARWV